jgi:isoquinoline 1-oxidoreductase beta subunit
VRARASGCASPPRNAGTSTPPTAPSPPANACTRASNRSADYGALAGAAAAVQLAQEPAIRAPKDYKLVGKWTPRLDTPVKLDGSAKFGIDAQVPGMVYAAVWSAPVYGGTLKASTRSGLRDLRGILGVVKLKDAVVVVADRYWRAKKGLDALKIEWDAGRLRRGAAGGLERGLRDTLDGPMFTAEKKGDPDAVFAAAAAAGLWRPSTRRRSCRIRRWSR